MDTFGICNAAKALAPVFDTLPAHLRDAANAVADNLFNNLLPPAMDKFTAAAKKIEDREEVDFEKAVNAASRAVYVYDLAQKSFGADRAPSRECDKGRRGDRARGRCKRRFPVT